MECPASSALPRDPDVQGEAALWGHRMHAWKAAPGSPGEDPQVEERWSAATAAGLTRDVLWPGGRHEVTYFHGPHGWTEAVLPGDEVERLRVSLPDAVMLGTLDWENRFDYPLPWIDDLKTGRFPPDLDNPQMLWYAAGVWSELSRRPAGVMVSITHWPRYPKANPPERLGPVVIPADRLARFLRDVEVARTRALAPDAIDVQNPGPWCSYCPSRRYCAAVGGTLTRENT